MEGGANVAKDYLLVDGYNIIHAWGELRDIAETDSLENARIKLLEEMSNYRGYHNVEIIVVFDAYQVKSSVRKYENYYDVDVVFTKEAESADLYIERIAHEVGRDYNVRVATSDGLQQLIILARGATRVSARELLQEVKQIKKEIREDYIEKSTQISRNRFEAYLDDDTKEWMEKMRRQ